MKKVILFIIFLTYAFGNNINHYNPKQLKQYATTRWEDIDNSELKQMAIKDFKIHIPKLLVIAKKPIVSSGKFNSSIKLYPKDYNFIFLYIRYLESKNRISEVADIYQSLYRVISNLNQKNSLLLEATYSILLNDLTNKSLKKTLNENILDKKSLLKITDIVEKNAILNRKTLFKAIENEYSIPVEYYKDKANHKEIAKILKKRGIDWDILQDELNSFSLFVDEECNRNRDYVLDIFKNDNPSDVEIKLSSYFKDIENSISNKNTMLKISKIEDRGSDKITQEDKEYLYQINAKFVCYYAIFANSISNLNSNYIKIIKKNRELLKALHKMLQ